MNGRLVPPAVAAAAIAALAPQQTSAETLTVVTINVWSGLEYRGSLKMGEHE